MNDGTVTPTSLVHALVLGQLNCRRLWGRDGSVRDGFMGVHFLLTSLSDMVVGFLLQSFIVPSPILGNLDFSLFFDLRHTHPVCGFSPSCFAVSFRHPAPLRGGLEHLPFFHVHDRLIHFFLLCKRSCISFCDVSEPLKLPNNVVVPL